MEPEHQAEMEVFCSKPMEDQGQGESGNQAGKKGATVSRASALFHFLHPSFVVRIVAHLAHPRFCEEQGRVPQESHHHRGFLGRAMETSGAAMLVGMLAGESPVRGTY